MNQIDDKLAITNAIKGIEYSINANHLGLDNEFALKGIVREAKEMIAAAKNLLKEEHGVLRVR